MGGRQHSFARAGVACLLSAVVLAGQGRAKAQESVALRRAAAQALFDEGKRLSQAGQFKDACPKLAESYRLDPAIGTQFYLGDCYENIGRLASAWVQFVDVAAGARQRGQTQREEAAKRRAAALEPRLTRLTVGVAEPVKGLQIRRNGVVLEAGQWGSPIPVDPGEYLVLAEAKGYRSWRKVVVAAREGLRVRIDVPALRAVTPRSDPTGSPKPSPKEDAVTPNNKVRKVRLGAAIGLGVAGVAAAAFGTAQGVIAINKKAAAEPYCRPPAGCFQEGLDLRTEARRAASLSTVGFGVAAGALIGAGILWFTLPPAVSPKAETDSQRGGWTLLPRLAPGVASGPRAGATRGEASAWSFGLVGARRW